MSVWLTSDLHIGHRKVAETRGYGYINSDIVTAHDAALAHLWDAVVHPDDHVWVLGDISAGGSAAQKNALQWIKQRPGHKHLIAGNHDGCHPMHRDSHKWQAIYLSAFDSVQMAAKRRVPLAQGHVSVMLSHFPYGPSVMPTTWTPDEWRELSEYPGYLINPNGIIKGRFGRPLKPYRRLAAVGELG